jgi:hypothetical protein
MAARRTPEQNRAIYQRRKARALAEGTTVYKRRVISVETPAARIVASFDAKAVMAALRRAGDRPAGVIVDLRDGRQLQLFPHYGWKADAMLADIAGEAPPKVKRAVLRWIEEERGVILGRTGSTPIGGKAPRGGPAQPDAPLQLRDLLRAQWVIGPRARGRAA